MLRLLYLIGLTEECPFICYRCLLATYLARLSFFLSLSCWLDNCMKLKLEVLLLVATIGAGASFIVIAILDFNTIVYGSGFGSCLLTSAELEYFSIIFLLSLFRFKWDRSSIHFESMLSGFSRNSWIGRLLISLLRKRSAGRSQIDSPLAIYILREGLSPHLLSLEEIFASPFSSFLIERLRLPKQDQPFSGPTVIVCFGGWLNY